MTEEQVRNDLWEAVVNQEFFNFQITATITRDRWWRISLIGGTVAGLAPLLKDVPSETLKACSVVSIISGLGGLIVLPQLGYQRRIEVLEEWRDKWIDIKELYFGVLRSFQSSGRWDIKSYGKAQECRISIEKSKRHFEHFRHVHFAEKAVEEATKWFVAKDLTNQEAGSMG